MMDFGVTSDKKYLYVEDVFLIPKENLDNIIVSSIYESEEVLTRKWELTIFGCTLFKCSWKTIEKVPSEKVQSVQFSFTNGHRVTVNTVTNEQLALLVSELQKVMLIDVAKFLKVEESTK